MDTNLVEALLATEGVNHQKGCFMVAGVMESRYADSFSVGVIDFDKKRPKYLNDFAEVASSGHLTLMKHKSRPHYLVLVKPAMDGFIMSCAEEIGADLGMYGLPTDLKALTRETKTVTTKKDARFKRLFEDLKDASEMVLLRNVLIYLKEHRFDSKEEEMRLLFK